MDTLPPPLPLRERGQYTPLPKPQWRLKAAHDSIPLSSLTYNLDLHFRDAGVPSGGRLVYSSRRPSNLSEFQAYCDYLLNNCPLPECVCETHAEDVLEFSSLFESGNLKEVYSLQPNEYSLYLHSDTNSQGNTQWFYFSVKNLAAAPQVKFTICNLTKPARLYKQGMKPWVNTGQQWQLLEDSVEFTKTTSSGKAMYSLSFTYSFQEPSSTVYFAFAMPYTFSRLTQFLETLEQTHSKYISFKTEELCKSVGGLPVHLIRLTSHIKRSHKKTIVFTGRVHPGETNGSYLVEGILKFLFSDSKYCRYLLENYVFVVIPMLNPDGVIAGNSRTGLAGVDLNRRWADPSAYTHPSIFACRKLLESTEIAMFCDFHAHSKKLNAFMYGCNQAANEKFTSWTKVRLFPRMLAGLSHYLSFEDCQFKVQPEKQGTARIVAWKELKITNSFTFECSVFGFNALNSTKPFLLANLYELSSAFMVTLYKYHNVLRSLENELKKSGGWLKPNRLKELSGNLASSEAFPDAKQRQLLNLLGVQEKEVEPESSGSDSAPSDDELEEKVELSFSNTIKKQESVERVVVPKPVRRANDLLLALPFQQVHRVTLDPWIKGKTDRSIEEKKLNGFLSQTRQQHKLARFRGLGATSRMQSSRIKDTGNRIKKLIDGLPKWSRVQGHT